MNLLKKPKTKPVWSYSNTHTFSHIKRIKNQTPIKVRPGLFFFNASTMNRILYVGVFFSFAYIMIKVLSAYSTNKRRRLTSIFDHSLALANGDIFTDHLTECRSEFSWKKINRFLFKWMMSMNRINMDVFLWFLFPHLYKKLTAHDGVDDGVDSWTRVQQEMWRQGKRLNVRMFYGNQHSYVPV